MSEKLEAAAQVGGIMDILQIVLNWLSAQDLPELMAEAKVLWETCAAALADGRVTLTEALDIAMKFIALLGKLKLAGFKG